ncbi:protein dachsous-like, partial [Diabrotica undecimpunctata]|uniref:protein dachsous-like n=1 Tax=Diabrotica undecimpunctata TaxID=50387 RepID=UPI003B642227
YHYQISKDESLDNDLQIREDWVHFFGSLQKYATQLCVDDCIAFKVTCRMSSLPGPLLSPLSIMTSTDDPFGGRSNIRYSIYSGDPDGLFSIDSVTGVIATASNLDHETKSNVLLNVQATSGAPPVYGHTQVNIEIEDVNDNAPEFDSTIVRISVPENVETGLPLYSAHAKDKDSGPNGIVTYKIVNNPYGGLFKIDSKLGDLTITRHLDYETSQRHSLMITATDTGVPPLSANLTVLVEVQDVNDNAPVFERKEYSLSILESLTVNTQ